MDQETPRITAGPEGGLGVVQLTDKQRRAKHQALELVDKGISAFVAQQGSGQTEASVVGVGIGQESVRVYVEGGTLPTGAVPDDFNGLQTMIIQTAGFTIAPVPGIQTAPARPTPCGVSVGHQRVTAGTLGCLVQDSQGTRYILSNNHVLADCNSGTIGDPIVQPGPADGGTVVRDVIAELAMWKPLLFGNSETNYIDAAIAKLTDPSSVQPGIQKIGLIKPVEVAASVGQSVHKHGRTTGHTTGVIGDVSLDTFVNYNGRRAWFENQIVIDTADFSLEGDSGSLIVNDPSNEAVGLLFAGDGTLLTLATPIDEVLAEFNVRLVLV